MRRQSTRQQHAQVPTRPEHHMPRCRQDQSITCHHATTCQQMLVCETRDTMCVRQEMACVCDGMIQAADKDAGSRQKRRDASMLLSRWRHKTREERGAQGTRQERSEERISCRASSSASLQGNRCEHALVGLECSGLVSCSCRVPYRLPTFSCGMVYQS